VIPSRAVIPWKCHICGGEFDTPGGGICSRCNRATCRTHLHLLDKKLKSESKWVCKDCIAIAEKKANSK
jgi:hypothetical protein